MTPRRGGAPATAEDVEARAARLGITAERVLEELARIAFSDISKIVNWDGDGKLKPKTPTAIGDAGLAAIAEIVASASSNLIYRVKLHDKRPALETLARHLGLLPASKAEPNGDDGKEDAVARLTHELDRLAEEAPAEAAAADGAAPAHL